MSAVTDVSEFPLSLRSLSNSAWKASSGLPIAAGSSSVGSAMMISSGIVRLSANPSSLGPSIETNIVKKRATNVTIQQTGSIMKFVTPFAQRFLIRFQNEADKIPANATPMHINSKLPMMIIGCQFTAKIVVKTVKTIKTASNTRKTTTGSQKLLK